MNHRRFACSLVLLGVFATFASAQSDAVEAEIRFFEAKVRPLLAEHCFKCHGKDKQRGGLRVDSRTALLQGGDLGPAIVLRDPDKSNLIKAVRHEVDDFKMPPSGKLRLDQIDVLTRWVKNGALWPGDDKEPPVAKKPGDKVITDKDRDHWAFKKVVRPAVPAVKKADWVVNPIDAFVLSKLEAKGLPANGPASKTELLRRATFNLTGLPPTPAEVEAFLKDESPKAYEDLIERLLKSPGYGEKWGRHWLDLVRFAETNSYERDNPKPNAWRFRDYVIRSFNDDKPYDVFIKEQLAGDEMPKPGPDQLIATGYYRLGLWDDEPVDRMQARYDGLDDIVATTSQVFLGLTVDCARCHEHKIDPIPHRDYYRLLAFFHNINHYKNGGPTDEAPLYTNVDAKKILEQRTKEIEVRRALLQKQIEAIEAEVKAKAGKILPAKSDIEDLKYRFFRSQWKNLPDFDNIKHEEDGKLANGFFDLAPRTRNDSYGFVFEGTLNVPQAGKYTFYLDSDDGSRLTLGDKKLIEYDGIHGVGKEHSLTVDLKAGRQPIRLDYFQAVGGYGLYVAWSGPGFERKMLSVPPSAKNASGDFLKAFNTEAPKVLSKERLKEYNALKKEVELLKKPDAVLGTERALIVSERGSTAPDTFKFARGNYAAPGERVTPGFPEVLGFADPVIIEPASGRSSGRRSVLADWLASRDNPLTARVLVNRAWHYHFGHGLVRSTSNFGYQGDRPTHPELLDWLASEFVERGWSLKTLHRIIMTSNVYRMSSKGNATALAQDPTNDLLWRFDMRRLSAEEVRDSILAVSGNLNRKMFGPGVYPEIPAEVLAGQSVPGRGWGKSSPDEQARRSVYVHVKRSLLLPILDSFDSAETDRSAPLRFTSTQPTQALLLINSAFINQQAKLFAENLRKEAGESVTEQVKQALYRATSRMPTADDVRRGEALVTALRDRDGATPERALTYFCLMVLNLNEFVYLD